MPNHFPLAFESDAVQFFCPHRRPDTNLIVVAGHTDTVPIEANVPGRIDGDLVWGRGAADMKGALAVMVELSRQLEPESLGADVGFLFFGREELSARDSALLPALEQNTDLQHAGFAILMEPTANALEAGCMGNLNLTLRFNGIAAHTGRPWLGSNAAHLVIETLGDLVGQEPLDVDIDGLVFREVASITGIRSGVARNVLPPVAEVDINVRYSPARSVSEIEALWVERFGRPNIDVEVIGNSPSAPVVGSHPLAQLLLSSGAEAAKPKQAWTNAADFALYGVPAVNFGPGDPVYAHRADEQVTGQALARSLDVLHRFLTASQ